MDNLCLAIPYIPVQKWSEIYDFATALEEGTVFPELNKPFFAAPERSNTTLSKANVPQLLFSQVCFALDDVLLYLDTHPGDMKAKELYETCLKKKKDLMSENECGCACISHYEWEQKPLVWEGGHC